VAQACHLGGVEAAEILRGIGQLQAKQHDDPHQIDPKDRQRDNAQNAVHGLEHHNFAQVEPKAELDGRPEQGGHDRPPQCRHHIDFGVGQHRIQKEQKPHRHHKRKHRTEEGKKA
jgi:hypothetical protein